MAQFSDTDTAEVLFTDGNAALQRPLARQVDAGTLRRIYAGVYTTNLDSPLEAIVVRNWAAIISHLCWNTPTPTCYTGKSTFLAKHEVFLKTWVPRAVR